MQCTACPNTHYTSWAPHAMHCMSQWTLHTPGAPGATHTRGAGWIQAQPAPLQCGVTVPAPAASLGCGAAVAAGAPTHPVPWGADRQTYSPGAQPACTRVCMHSLLHTHTRMRHSADAHIHTHTCPTLPGTGWAHAALPNPRAVPSWLCHCPTTVPGRCGTAALHARGISLPVAPVEPCATGGTPHAPQPGGRCAPVCSTRTLPCQFPTVCCTWPDRCREKPTQCSSCTHTARPWLSRPERAASCGLVRQGGSPWPCGHSKHWHRH